MGRLNDKNALNILPSTLAEAAFSSLCEHWPFKQALSSNMFSDDVYSSYKLYYKCASDMYTAATSAHI